MIRLYWKDKYILTSYTKLPWHYVLFVYFFLVLFIKHCCSVTHAWYSLVLLATAVNICVIKFYIIRLMFPSTLEPNQALYALVSKNTSMIQDITADCSCCFGHIGHNFLQIFFFVLFVFLFVTSLFFQLFFILVTKCFSWRHLTFLKLQNIDVIFLCRLNGKINE